MDLFDKINTEPLDVLPYDGSAVYYGPVLDTAEADSYMSVLMESIEWKNDEAIIFGKRIITKRKVAWYADKPFSYTYSKTTKQALPWTPALLELKEIAQQISQATFNSCLLNLYHDGTEGMAWHSDAEKDLKKNGEIASLSFGAERRFCFKHKTTKQTISQVLKHGSLLVMRDTTQTHWLHRLPPTKAIQHPRINLTFRTIAE